MDKHNLLHPSLPVKNLKKKDEALLIKGKKNGKFAVFFLNAQFEELPKSTQVPVKDFPKFLDSPACRNLKAVMILLNDLDNSSHIVNLEIRQMVYEEVRKRKWHLYLVYPRTNSIMSMLFFSKIDSKPGDVILIITSWCQMVSVSQLRRKQEGYSYIVDKNFTHLNRNIDDVASEILATCNPRCVTVSYPLGNDLAMSLKSRVPSKNVFYIGPEDIVGINPQVLKTIFDHGYNQVIPSTMDELAVTNESNFTVPEQAVITVDHYEELPLEKVHIVPKSNKPYYVAYLDETSETYEPAEKSQLSKEQNRHHRIKLALVVDRNSLPFLYQEPYLIPEIQTLPCKLAAKANLNVPVIGFYDNSSVICVHDETGYKFLNEWNGLYGNDLYLTFEQEENTMITNLYKVKSKDPFMVYDLIKILSMTPNDLKADPNWGFKVTSNSKNPVLLQFETFLGTRKSSTPIFLMALLLKHHINAIMKETGKKPKELGFCLFNEFSNEEKKRIKSGLKEACKLLEIVFVAVSSV